MPKSSKRFIISTEAVNSYGFRILTDGIDLNRYKNNPILLFNHQRPEGSSTDQILLIGYMDDLQIKDKVLSGVPVFDDSDTFAMSIYKKVENGTLRMCSAALEPIAVDANRSNWLPGQKLPTVTKSVLDEVSICDIGSNPDSLAVSLYDRNRKLINLSALKSDEILLILSDTGSDQTKASQHTTATRSIVKNALAVGKLSDQQADLMLSMPADKDTVNGIYGVIKNTPVNKTGVLDGQYHPTLLKQASKTWDQIQLSEPGGMTKLKAHAPELYKAKFFEKHDRMPSVV